ncbi:MAG: hypothetical protein OEZ36_09225 [Spirochaetota bacterium]|nr:hypothetical protein [Spirochaetota bacterium]
MGYLTIKSFVVDSTKPIPVHSPIRQFVATGLLEPPPFEQVPETGRP